MEYLLLIVGLAILVVSGDALVDSSTGIARFFKLPTLIIGLTIVAFGTSAPELFVSVMSGLNGHSSMAVGNVIGSNCINVSVIVGITALICPFVVSKQSITVDTMFMLFLTLVLLGFGVWGNGISRFEGMCMFLMLLAFVVWSIKKAKAEVAAQPQPETEKTDDGEKKEKPLWLNCVILVAAIAGLAVGAHLMVGAASNIARSFEVSERIIAVTVVALGTSLPELTASVMGALKGESDLTVGNIVGSNIFNIGSVLALSSTTTPINFVEPAALAAMGAAVANEFTTTAQFTNDMLWMFAFEVMLLIGMINVTNNFSLFKKTGEVRNLFSAEDGLVGRIWGACALAMYAYYVYLLLNKAV